MKKIRCVLLIVFLLCGCSGNSKDINIPNNSINSIFQSTESPTESDVTTAVNYEPPPVYLEREINTVDGTGAVPLFFIDTTIHQDRAYLMFASKDGMIFVADQFLYNGESLYSKYLYDGRMILQDEPANSPIFEENRELVFKSNCGKDFRIYSNKLTTTGRTSDEFILTHIHFDSSIPDYSNLYIGSYADTEIFPREIEYFENSICIDLDQNGKKDSIVLEMLENDQDEFYDYKITIERNQGFFEITNDEYSKVAQNDVQVFVADIDQDKEFEIILWKKTYSRFSSITVYSFYGIEYQDELFYAISPLY